MSLCECGCGQSPRLPTSRFLPGHDWRRRPLTAAARPAPVRAEPDLAEPDETPTEYGRTLSMLHSLAGIPVSISADPDDATEGDLPWSR